MGSVVVVLEAPVVEEELCFEQGVERLQVEQFAAEVPVEGLDVWVLPRRSWLDVGDGRSLEAAPVLERFGGQLGAVVAADVGGRLASSLDDLLEGADGVVGRDPAGRGRRSRAPTPGSGRSLGRDRACAVLAAGVAPWLVVASPRLATTAAPACGYTPSPAGIATRGCAGSRTADGGGQAAVAAPAAAPRRQRGRAGSAVRTDTASCSGRLVVARPGSGLADA